MNLISTKFRSEMDIAQYNDCIFVSNMAYTFTLKDIQTNLDDIRLHIKTKHKTDNISTITAILGAIWVPKEAKLFR